MGRHPLKVLLLIHSLKYGGAEIMVEHLAHGLMELGCDVMVVSLHDTASEITDRMKSRGIPLRTLGKRQGFDPRTVFQISSIIRQERVEILHSHLCILHYAAGAALLNRRVKLFHTLHSMAQYETPSKALRRINRVIYHARLARPVCLSRETAKTAERLYGLRQGSVPHILNGIDLHKFRCERDARSQDVFNIIHVGRLTPVKRQDKIIEAVRVLKDRGVKVRLKIVGEGLLYDDLSRTVEEARLQDEVELLGASNEVEKWMAMADAFVLASDHEGIPLVIAEALASGLPVISTRVGGLPSMIENDVSGLFFDGSSTDLAVQIERLVHDEELRRLLQLGAKEASRKFAYQTMARSYYDLYHS